MKKTLTKEETELLIKDLLLRTQTDVIVKVPGEDEPKALRILKNRKGNKKV